MSCRIKGFETSRLRSGSTGWSLTSPAKVKVHQISTRFCNERNLARIELVAPPIAERVARIAPIGIELNIHNVDHVFDATHTNGGDWMRLNGQNACTSGFSATDNSTGYGGVITAGHCVVTHNRQSYSPYPVYDAPYVRQHLGTYGDVEFHTTTHLEFDDFYANHSTQWDVTGEVGSFSIGQWYNRYGKKTGNESAQINHLGVSVWFPASLAPPNGVLVHNLVRTNYADDDKGDSGGPWYKWNRNAAGIHSGHSTPDPVTFVISYSYFSRIKNAESALNVSVMS